MSNGLDPDEDQHSVGPDLGKTICIGYQQMTTVSASKEMVRLGLSATCPADKTCQVRNCNCHSEKLLNSIHFS